METCLHREIVRGGKISRLGFARKLLSHALLESLTRLPVETSDVRHFTRRTDITIPKDRTRKMIDCVMILCTAYRALAWND